MNVSASARIIAAVLNTISASCEMPHEFRHHAMVLNEHLAELLCSGMFDDIDDFSNCSKGVFAIAGHHKLG
jgi:hypothetical protein